MEIIEKKDQKYIRAQARLKELKTFYAALSSYVLVNLFLAFINYMSNGWSNMWFLWPLFGWGFGVAMHAFKVFGFMGIYGKEWEERKIKELMDKDSSDKWQ